MAEKVLRYEEMKDGYTEERFEDPVKKATHRAVIDYCNEKNITLDEFCRIALEQLNKVI